MMQWHQLDHMQTICTSLQTDNHINTSSFNFYRPDALLDTQATVSKHWTRPNNSCKSGNKGIVGQGPWPRESGGAEWWVISQILPDSEGLVLPKIPILWFHVYTMEEMHGTFLDPLDKKFLATPVLGWLLVRDVKKQLTVLCLHR